MRIVSPAEAVAGIRSGEQVFVHGGAATPSVLLDALVARASELRGREHGPLPHRGTRPAPRARRWPALPAQGALHRRQRPAGGERGTRRLRADLPLRRPATCSPPGTLPLDVALLNVTRPDAHGFCSLGTSVDAAMAASRTAKVVIAQLNASMPRTLGDTLHPRLADRPRGRGRRAALRARRAAARGGRATDRRARGRADRGRRHAPAGDRRHPVGHRARAARQARPRDPHRDVHRRGDRPGRARGRSPGRARRSTAARSCPPS